jgi:pyruvate dehydrogenase E2 component (dihydrolipoamide acetyltransferase)
MITKVVLAKLSPTMEEGTIVKWSKREGDPIKVGDVLAEIETDKANMEMEALGAGVLRKVLVPAGGKAPIGALIGVIADPGDDIEPLLATAAVPAPAAPAPPVESAPPASAPAPVESAPAVAESAPEPAPAPVSPLPPSVAVPAGRIKASPLARAIAERENIPLDSIAGTGPGGRILRRDVEAVVGPGAVVAASAARHPQAFVPPPAAAAAPAPAPVATLAGQSIALSGMRKTIARRLAESKFQAPHFYVSMEIDMERAVALREELLAVEGVKVSFNDLVLRACAKALVKFPMVNAAWGGDKIVTSATVDLGVAVAIPDGLITPVVRGADRKSVVEISREVKDLAARAKEKKLKPEEYSGAGFTVSNLGMFDVSEFTAIINPPGSAILAVGAVRKVPVVKDDAVVPGQRMKVTMSSDHRVIDGALAAQFLQEVRRLLEHPLALLV